MVRSEVVQFSSLFKWIHGLTGYEGVLMCKGYFVDGLTKKQLGGTDAAYPASTAIKLILDNHSAHISRETTAWLDARPPGRFEFTFTLNRGLQIRAVGPPQPRYLKKRTQRAHYGRH
jgi:hypothetical protein